MAATKQPMKEVRGAPWGRTPTAPHPWGCERFQTIAVRGASKIGGVAHSRTRKSM